LKLLLKPKKVVLVTICFLIGCIVASQTSAEESSVYSWNIILDQKRAPFSYINESDEAEGLMVDIWRLIGEKSNRKINFELLDLQHSLHKVKGSDNHIHGGIFDFDQHDTELLFSSPVVSVRSAVFINNLKLSGVLDFSDINHIRLGVTAGSAEEKYLSKRHPKMQLQLYNNQAQLVEAAVRGDINAFVVEYQVGMHYLSKSTTPDQFRVLTILYKRDIRAAVTINNPDLLDDINQAIAKVTPDDLNHITQKWIAQETIEVFPDWALFFLPGGIGILLLLFWYLHASDLRRKIRQQKDKIYEQEKHVLLLTSNMSDWVWTLDANYLFSYSSPSIEKLLGFHTQDLMHQSLNLVMPPREVERLNAHISSLISHAKRGEVIGSRDSTILLDLTHKNGHVVWTETALRIFFDLRGNFIGAQGASRNITERKHAEDIMRQMAFNDPLTHLPNRRLLVDRIQQAMAACVRTKQYCALLFLDIDNFKYINDNYGHDNGDNLLQQIALRLSSGLRESDTVARFGGDEFVIVSERLSHELESARHQALLIGIKTLELFDRHFYVRDIECKISTSIGILLFNDDSLDVNSLIKKADLAMYQAKAQGRNRVIISEFNQDA
jgi:diguanylate cyclase (GGDEF)-like protein/PAS domain S-box-containing protein